MDPIWRPEREVDVDLARRLVARTAPELAGSAVEPFGVGFDNVAYLVGGAWVFRFPQRAVAADLVAAEARVLGQIADALPVAVPNPAFVGAPSEAYPWTYAGYRVLPGLTLDRARLDDGARANLAEPLALFLRALHAVPASLARDAEVPHDLLGRMDLERRVAMSRERLREADARGWLDAASYHPIVDAVDVTLPLLCDVLCHGDLYDRHLLIDPDTLRLTGVIDWGDVHLGDPGVDLAVAHRVLPPSAHAAFREAHGPISEPRWNAARMKALQHALSTLFYARDVGDASLDAGCLVSLHYLADAARRL